MKLLIPKKPFQKTLEFTGSIFNNDFRVDDLHMVIYWSRNEQSIIQGKVFGNKETYSRLSSLFNQRTNYYNLEVKGAGRHVFSDRLSFRNLSDEHVQNCDPYTRTYEVAIFELMDIFEITQINFPDIKKRSISFFLAGPKAVWRVFQSMELSHTGEIKNKITNENINLFEDYQIKIEPLHFYDSDSEKENYRISTNILELTIETELTEEIISSDKFIEMCIEVTNDILLLASFISKQWIIWYGYVFSSCIEIREYFKRSRATKDIKIYEDELIVKRHEIYKFFENGFKELRKLRTADFDLTLPITYIISGEQSGYTEEKFMTTFLGLEKIKDMYAIQKGITKNIGSNKFRKLQSDLKKYLLEHFKPETKDDTKNFKKVVSKLPELNRPSLRHLIDGIFEEFKLDWKVVYPPNSDFTLIKTRDSLFHTSHDFESWHLFKEYKRLHILLSILILKILKWDSFSEAFIRQETAFLRK